MRSSFQLKASALASVFALGTLALASGSPALADHHKSMEKSEANIVEAATGTGMHETLVAAVEAAGLVETLSGPGPFTVFAPTDDAFAALPDGTVSTLVQPENKDQLTGILTYHVVAGAVSSSDLAGLISANGGSATIDTVAGGQLTARMAGDTLTLTDAAGRSTSVTKADVAVSNGVIHVTDGVFLPG